jgi:hypothetical protein
VLNANARVAFCFFRRLVSIFLAGLLIFSLHWLLFQGREIVPGVTTRPLGPCHLDWFSERVSDGIVPASGYSPPTSLPHRLTTIKYT